MVGTSSTLPTGSNNFTTSSPGLAASLANNGGLTQTLALLSGSPAFQTGDPGQVNTISQNAATRPATPDIGAFQTLPPTVTMSTANLPDNSPTMTINGTGFDTNPANDSVAFDNGVTGSVLSATVASVTPDGTQMTVTITSPPTALASLTAFITTDGASSGDPVQVSTEVNGTWTVTDPGSGDGSFSDITLSYAVATYLGGATIAFDASLSGATIAPTSTLALNSNVTITGLGAANLAVSGSNAHEVFSVASGVTVSISDMTVENGLGVTLSTATFGTTSFAGAIYNQGSLSLTGDIVLGNTAAVGGAIYSLGTIANPATLTLTNDIFFGNTANGNNGGAIYCDTATTLTVNYSTFISNTANRGGGAFHIASGDSATIGNSTFWGNSATFASPFGGATGGAINNVGSLTLISDTIAGNSAAGSGGGINGTVASMDNTIVANNTAGGNPSDMSGIANNANYNLFGTSSGVVINGANNLTDVSAGLASGPPTDNGGSTPTLALINGSPAQGAGDPGLASTISQNGIYRPFAPDIGAYQTLGPVPAVTSVVINGGPIVTIDSFGQTPNLIGRIPWSSRFSSRSTRESYSIRTHSASSTSRVQLPFPPESRRAPCQSA